MVDFCNICNRNMSGRLLFGNSSMVANKATAENFVKWILITLRCDKLQLLSTANLFKKFRHIKTEEFTREVIWSCDSVWNKIKASRIELISFKWV